MRDCKHCSENIDRDTYCSDNSGMSTADELIGAEEHVDGDSVFLVVLTIFFLMPIVAIIIRVIPILLG